MSNLRAAALAFVFTASGCVPDVPSRPPASAESAEAFQVVLDARGVRLSTIEPRRRVVSLVPALTEIVTELGAQDQLVGRTRFDEDPRIVHVSSVGGALNPDVEAIVGLKPDLVITWYGADTRSLSDRLESLGIPVYAAAAERVSDFERHTVALGRLLGRSEAAAELLWRVRSGLEDARVDVSEADRPGVLFVVWPNPLVTTGRGTFVQELIRLVGARGLFDDLGEPWPTVSFESVLERDPDVVIVAGGHAKGVVPAWIEHDPTWRRLEAVRAGRLHFVDADVFNRPGPNMAVAAAELADYVWGEGAAAARRSMTAR